MSWWNTDWQYRNTLSLNAEDIGENLVEFPVMVKLNSTRVNFNEIKIGGADVRFIDKDDTTELPYEIEYWNDTNKLAYIWVKVPQIDAGSVSTDCIYMYHGNPNALDGQNAKNVWDGAAGVWHLGNLSNGAVVDSTGNMNKAVNNGATPVVFDLKACKFGVFSDTQYLSTGSTENLDAFVAEMNVWKPDFVIELGDYIYGETNRETTLANLDVIEAIYDGVAVPKYHVLGNHDLDKNSKQDFFNHTSMVKRYYSFDYKDMHFVVLDACFKSDDSDYDSGNFDGVDTNIPSEELAWLENDLAGTSKSTIAFIHQILTGDGTGIYDVNNAPEVRSIFEASGKVVAVFSAHAVIDSLNSIEGIDYYNLCGMDGGSYPHMKVWTGDTTASIWVEFKNGEGYNPPRAGLNFDGINDYMTIPDSTSLQANNGTWELLLRFGADSVNERILCKNTVGYNDDAYLRLLGGKIQFMRHASATSSAISISSNNTILRGKLYDIGVVWGVGGMKMCVDAVLQNETNSNAGPVISSGQPLLISSPDNCLKMTIEEVRYWESEKSTEWFKATMLSKSDELLSYGSTVKRGKRVKEDKITYLFTLTRGDGINPVEVSCRADYTVTCNSCGQTTANSRDNIELATEQVNVIKDLGAAILAAIKEAEQKEE